MVCAHQTGWDWYQAMPFPFNRCQTDCDSLKVCPLVDVVKGPGDLYPVMLKLVMTQSIPTALHVLTVMSLIKRPPSFPW